VSAERRSVYMDATLSGASYFMTPLSLKYTLDRLAPQLEDALAGRAPQRMIETSD
jgi:iron complex transport system substrate-binding protein